MSLNSSLAQRRFSLPGGLDLIADEGLRGRSSCRQFWMFLEMCFKAYGINGPRFEMGQ
jgi:hypothetical protein